MVRRRSGEPKVNERKKSVHPVLHEHHLWPVWFLSSWPTESLMVIGIAEQRASFMTQNS